MPAKGTKHYLAQARMREAVGRYTARKDSVGPIRGDRDKIKEWYYWHRREIRELNRLGVCDCGLQIGEYLL